MDTIIDSRMQNLNYNGREIYATCIMKFQEFFPLKDISKFFRFLTPNVSILAWVVINNCNLRIILNVLKIFFDIE